MGTPTVRNSYARPIMYIKEACRSYWNLLKRPEAYSKMPFLYGIKSILETPNSKLIADLRTELENLYSINGGKHPVKYYLLNENMREALFNTQATACRTIIDKVNARYNVDLYRSPLIHQFGWPESMLTEVNRSSKLSLRMVTVVSDEWAYSEKALKLAFELGQALAEHDILPVIGQDNPLIRSMLDGLHGNGGSSVGILENFFDMPDVTLRVQANVGDLRASILTRSGRVMIKLGSDDLFKGIFRTHGQERPSDTFGAQVTAFAREQAIDIHALDPETSPDIVGTSEWLQDKLCFANGIKKYSEALKARPYQIAIIGSMNTNIDSPINLTTVPRSIGKWYGENNFSTSNGGGPGTMETLAEGVAISRGIAIGLSPDISYVDCNKGIDIPIPTGVSFGRDCMVPTSGGFVTSFPGLTGTIDEIIYGMKHDRHVISLFGPIPEDASGYHKLHRVYSEEELKTTTLELRDRLSLR